MVTTAAGSLSLTLDRLCDTIAKAAAFRTWIGASGSDADQNTQAKGRVFFDELPPPDTGGEYTREQLEALRPFALIRFGNYHSESDSTGDASSFATRSGSCMLRFVEDVPDAIHNNIPEIGRRIRNAVGQVLDDMEALREIAGYLTITSIDIPEDFQISPEDELETQGVTAELEVLVGFQG